MNQNTERSSPILTNAIMEGTTKLKRLRACSLVTSALGDRDRELNKAWEKYENVKNRYNTLVSELDNIKSRPQIT